MLQTRTSYESIADYVCGQNHPRYIVTANHLYQKHFFVYIFTFGRYIGTSHHIRLIFSN